MGFASISSLKKRNVKQKTGLINTINYLLSREESQKLLTSEGPIEYPIEFNVSAAKQFKCELESPAEEKISEKLIKTDISQLEKLVDPQSVPRKGFENEGNTCYFNTALQILFNLKAFRRKLENSYEGAYTWLDLFKKLFHDCTTNKKRPVKINEFEKIILSSNGMDGFRENLQNKDSKHDTRRKKLQQSKAYKALQGDILEFLQICFEKLPEEFSDQFNTFNNSSPTILMTVNDFMTEENFGEVVYHKIKENARKNVILTPECMLIGCLRSTFKDGQVIKDNTSLEIPKEFRIENTRYVLNGIGKHIGSSSNSGHYIAYCKGSSSDQFFEYDDSNVTLINYADVMNKTRRDFALLSYEKLNETNKQIKEINDNLTNEMKISTRKSKDISDVTFSKASKEKRSKVKDRMWHRKNVLNDLGKYKDKLEKMKLRQCESRLDPVFREEDNSRRAKGIKIKRNAETQKKQKPIIVSKVEKNRKHKERMRKNRLNAHFSYREKLIKVFSKHKKASPEKEYLETLKKMQQVPASVCACCQRLNFIDSMHKSMSEKTAYEKVKANYEKNNGGKKYPKKLFYEQCIAIKSKNMQFCRSCANNFYKGSIPLYAPLTGIKLRPIPEEISSLTDLEETLLKPVVGFMQIKDMKPYARFTEIGAKGPTINIHMNVPDVVNILPRQFNDTSIIQIKLKRHLKFRKAYMFETVSIKRLYTALNILKDTELYKDMNIKIDKTIFENLKKSGDDDQVDFVIDPDDSNDKNDLNEEEQQELSKELEEAKKFAEELNKEYGTEGGDLDTLVFQMPIGINNENYKEVLNVTDKDILDLSKQVKQNQSDSDGESQSDKLKLIEIAPGQGKKPQIAREIDYYDEKCNPRAYGGYKLEYSREDISIVKRYKAQISMKDRRFCSPAMILFKAKRKLEHQLANCIFTALRKSKKGTLTVKDILNPEKLQKLCEDDEAYRFMQGITITPGYLERSKKRAMAMIRQLGHPSFFLTLSPKEHHWPELLKLLWETKHNDIIEIESVNCLSDLEKNELIRSDPVLVTTFFSNRLNKIMEYLQKKANLIFGDHWVVDFIRRREYQMRGAPHEHIILYNKDVMVYSDEMKDDLRKKLMEFIDNIITCENDPKNPNVFYQYHVCTQSCWKKNKLNDKTCRFKYPRFPMKETDILKPLKGESEYVKRAEENCELIKQKLASYNAMLKNHWIKQKNTNLDEKEEESESKMSDSQIENQNREEQEKDQQENEKFLQEFPTFDDMLSELKMSNKEYKDALRTTIRCDTIFHQRAPNAININNYNKALLDLWQSNCDLQFIIDPYAAISYLFSYILKTDKGIIRLMSEAVKESHEAGEKQFGYLRKIANAFNNALVIGASQAADYLMGVPLTRFSRDVIFINTNRPKDRIGIKKPTKILKELAEDDTDIFELGLIDKYEARPQVLENVCLADFAAKYRENSKYKHDSDLEKYQERKTPRVIRFIGYSKKKNEIEFYREQLMLYFPWKNENNELTTLELDDLKAKYEENKDIIEQKFIDYNKIKADDLEQYRIQMIEEQKEEGDEEENEGFYQHRRNHDDSEDEIEDYDAFPHIGDKNADKNDKKKAKPKKDTGPSYVIKLPPRVPDEEIEKILQNLNTDQRRILYAVYDAFQNGIKDLKIFLTGTAGKFLIIHLISKV